MASQRGPPQAWERERPDPRGGQPVQPAADSACSDDESDLSQSDGEDNTWVSWFCSLKGNEFFVEVDEEFIQDDFNLTGLGAQVPYYEYALDTILDVEMPRDAGITEEQQDSIEAAAELLYGLIHARYIITPRGMSGMLEKYKNIHFGRCPRVFCQGQPVLPVGQSDIPRTHTCKTFCPKCEDIYYPRSSRHANIDGAYFGTTFCHLFFQTYWDMVPLPPKDSYVPRIFGFKIHKKAAAQRGAASTGTAASQDGSRAGAGDTGGQNAAEGGGPADAAQGRRVTRSLATAAPERERAEQT